MRMQLPYGTAPRVAECSWGRCLGILDIADLPGPASEDEMVRVALERPIGTNETIFQVVRPGETVAVIVSDAFRETGVNRILPVLMEGLNRAGVKDDAVQFIFATGVHRPPTPAEQLHILGQEIYRRFGPRALVHDPRDESNLVRVGATSRGTVVRLNKRAFECDRIIATGAIVLHYFAGFGGGRKSIVPGICAVDTIAQNHALNLRHDGIDPAVRAGALDGNPVAEDMLEGARLCHVDCVINTVLDCSGAIVGVFAGELDAAHRAGAELARRLYGVPIGERADLVVAAAGPRRNFVQSHKALYNAYQAVKPDGRIILLAPCEEGLGGEQFEKWLRFRDRDALLAALRSHSEINGQTALSTFQKAPITVMVTELPENQTAQLRARKAPSLQDALAIVRPELPSDPTYYLMPSAAYTVPFSNTLPQK